MKYLIYLIPIFIFADISEAILYSKNKNQINQKDIIALIKQESNFNKYEINLNRLTEEQIKLLEQINSDSIEKLYYFKWNKKFCTIKIKNNVKEKDVIAKKLINFFYKNNFNQDIGLMQINTSHFEEYNILNPETLLDEKVNILVGSHCYKRCLNKYNQDKIKASECYNKGKYFGESEYSSKFMNNLSKLN